MEFTPNEDTSPERSNSAEIATLEELDRLTLLAGLLLETGTVQYGTESIRGNESGSIVLQTSVTEIDGVNRQSSTIIITDADDQLAEFYFIDSTEYPIISIYPDKAEQARDILISLITSGKLDETEIQLALYCIRHFASDLEGYEFKEDKVRYLEIISKQVQHRNKDFLVITNYNNENDAEDYEITISTVTQSNPKRHTSHPKLQIVLDDQTVDVQISLIQKPDGSFAVVETDLYEIGVYEETQPESYHVKKLQDAIIKELELKGISHDLHSFTIDEIPYLDLINMAKQAYQQNDSLHGIDKLQTAEIFYRAMELLRYDFESRYHLIGGRDDEDTVSGVNLKDLPAMIIGEVTNIRNMLLVRTPYLYIEEEGEAVYSQIHINDTSLVTIEYGHLEEFRLKFGGEAAKFDICLVSMPNRLTNGKRCVIPLSSMIVMQFAPLNN